MDSLLLSLSFLLLHLLAAPGSGPAFLLGEDVALGSFGTHLRYNQKGEKGFSSLVSVGKNLEERF